MYVIRINTITVLIQEYFSLKVDIRETGRAWTIWKEDGIRFKEDGPVSSRGNDGWEIVSFVSPKSYFVGTIELGGHCRSAAVAPLSEEVILGLEYRLSGVALSVDGRLIRLS